MNDIELKMLENGFTKKELYIFRKYIRKDMSLTHRGLLNELKNRFYGMSGVLIVLIAIWMAESFEYSGQDFLCFSLAMGFGVVMVFIMTPMKLAFKAVRFLKKL